MAKIFVRERNRVREGDAQPRFAVVAAQGDGIKFFSTHVRKAEIEAIAQELGADIVWLARGAGENAGEGSGDGGGRRQGGRRHGSGGGASA